MKELKTTDEINDVLNGSSNVLVKFGQPGCIPCKIVGDSLATFEVNKEFNLEYYCTENIDTAIERGYTKLPAVVLKVNGSLETMTDNSVLMDEDELKNWIKSKLN